MSFISEITQSQWQSLIDQTEPQRPSVGKHVRVVEGRKHLGKEGIVTWHGIDKYSDTWHYCSDAQKHLRDLRGRCGYRVRIDTGTEQFFISADKVEVITSDKDNSDHESDLAELEFDRQDNDGYYAWADELDRRSDENSDR